MADEPKEQQTPPKPAGEKPAASPSPQVTLPAKTEGATPPAPKPPAPAKAPVSMQTPLNNELVTRLRAKFASGILEAIEDRKQAILIVECARLAEVALHLRDEEKFDLLSDLTAVDWPKREKRFDIVLNLYSFPKNERVRVKAHAAEGEQVPSVFGIWPTAKDVATELAIARN